MDILKASRAPSAFPGPHFENLWSSAPFASSRWSNWDLEREWLTPVFRTFLPPVTGWVFQEADAEMEFGVEGIFKRGSLHILWRAREEVTVSGEKLTAIQPIDNLSWLSEAEWHFRISLSKAEMVWPLYPWVRDQSQGEGLWEGVTLASEALRSRTVPERADSSPST